MNAAEGATMATYREFHRRSIEERDAFWQWDAAPGAHVLEVRATDSTGAVQPGRRTAPFPRGATGWSSTQVAVG